jgi:hypothetical protein
MTQGLYTPHLLSIGITGDVSQREKDESMETKPKILFQKQSKT